jgi:diacylglycerol kinase (ATP)
LNAPARSTDGLSGTARILRAVRVGFAALSWAWKQEEAVRLELLSASLLLILIVELLNTGLEVVVDRISTERHELSGLAKDLGSAAVMISLFLAAIVWGCILIR